jgi:hypothetical protein
LLASTTNTCASELASVVNRKVQQVKGNQPVGRPFRPFR